MKRVFHEIFLVILAFLRHLLCHTRNCDEEKPKLDESNGGDNNDSESN